VTLSAPIILHFFALLYFSLPALAAAQTAAREPAFRDNFYDVVIKDQDAWIVGYYGTLLHSRDGGRTWTLQESKTREALFRIASPEKNFVWVSGSYGTILHSRDRGETWQKQQSNTEEQLLGLHFLDSRLGWIVGSRGVVLRTENGGETWEGASIGEDVILNDVHFINPKEGWAVGEFGRIYQTGDGGRSWAKQKSPIEVSLISGESRNLFRLVFGPANGAWAFGLDGAILKAQDGRHWEEVLSPNGSAPAERHHLFSAAFFNGKKFAVGERGTILSSSANGEPWTRARLKIPPVSLNGIGFGKHGLGLIVGNRGLILASQNGGTSWKQINVITEGQRKE
jgi:photosystem II stability/assembly factor-like uncharacterized protein